MSSGGQGGKPGRSLSLIALINQVAMKNQMAVEEAKANKKYQMALQEAMANKKIQEVERMWPLRPLRFG